MATTSRASCKRVEDVGIFQVLEESTDSDVTVFSSEKDEDGNDPDTDEDGLLDDNSETNENGCTRTRGPKTPDLKWTIILYCKELQKYENLSGPNIVYQLAAVRKTFLSYFSPMIYTTNLRKKQINMELYHKEKREQWITTRKTQMRKKSKRILEF